MQWGQVTFYALVQNRLRTSIALLKASITFASSIGEMVVSCKLGIFILVFLSASALQYGKPTTKTTRPQWSTKSRPDAHPEEGHSKTNVELDKVLQDRFGLEMFRPGQLDIVESVTSGSDTLVVLPTGGGKSLCYQLPAVVMGTTLVVSPLIALMADQVAALGARGVRASFINSMLSSEERGERLRAAQQGAYELLYVSPERFDIPSFVDTLGSMNVRLLAIDEVCCLC